MAGILVFVEQRTIPILDLSLKLGILLVASYVLLLVWGINPVGWLASDDVLRYCRHKKFTLSQGLLSIDGYANEKRNGEYKAVAAVDSRSGECRRKSTARRADGR